MAEETTPQAEEQPEETADIQQADADGAETGEEAFDYPVAVEDAGTLKKKISVTVPRERIDAKRDEMFGELADSAQVPGFRIGRAPRRLLEKRFGKEVGDDVRNALIGEALGKAVEKSELRTLGEPDLDLEAIELPDEGDMEFSFEVEVAPEFELPELKDIPVRRPKFEVDDERIDEQLDRIAQSMTRYEPADGKADDGDLVVAGAVVTVEGCDPVESHGLNLRVAPGQVEGLPLVDLGDKLKGAAAGDTVTLEVDVPEAHTNEDWRGKKASVEISVSEVRSRVVPEIDDEYAQQRGYESLEQLRGDIASQLSTRVATESQQFMRQEVRNYLLEKIKFDLPEGVARRHAARMLQRRYVDLLQRSIREQIDERLTELQAAVEAEAALDLKSQFILAKIVEDLEIEISDGEMNARVAEMARQYNRRPERMRQELESDGTLESLQAQMAEEKAIDRLLADAKVTEVDPAELSGQGEGEDKPAKKKTKKKAAKKSAKKADEEAEEKTEEDAPKKSAKKPAAKTEKKTKKKSAKKSDK